MGEPRPVHLEQAEALLPHGIDRAYIRDVATAIEQAEARGIKRGTGIESPMTNPTERSMERLFDSALFVPEAFHAWAKALPERARTCLSIHELRQIWEERAAALDEAREEGRREGAEAYAALERIATYADPEDLQEHSEDAYGLSAYEAIEMAYDNVLNEARSALRSRSKSSEPTEGDCICPPSISDCPEELSGRPCRRRKPAEGGS